MLEPIIADIQQAVENEANRAKLIHGEKYASLHEAWGVLSEEELEGRTEGERIVRNMTEMLYAIQTDDRYRLVQELRNTRKRAINAACEYIQVAAVCTKTMDWLAGEKNG